MRISASQLHALNEVIKDIIEINIAATEPPAMMVFGYPGKLAFALIVIGFLFHIPVTTSAESSQSASPTFTGFMCFNGLVCHLPPCGGDYSGISATKPTSINLIMIG